MSGTPVGSKRRPRTSEELGGSGVGYIQWVSTDFAWRRRGLARAITVGLLDWFTQRQVRAVELHATPEAQPSNLAARLR